MCLPLFCPVKRWTSCYTSGILTVPWNETEALLIYPTLPKHKHTLHNRHNTTTLYNHPERDTCRPPACPRLPPRSTIHPSWGLLSSDACVSAAGAGESRMLKISARQFCLCGGFCGRPLFPASMVYFLASRAGAAGSSVAGVPAVHVRAWKYIHGTIMQGITICKCGARARISHWSARGTPCICASMMISSSSCVICS